MWKKCEFGECVCNLVCNLVCKRMCMILCLCGAATYIQTQAHYQSAHHYIGTREIFHRIIQNNCHMTTLWHSIDFQYQYDANANSANVQLKWAEIFAFSLYTNRSSVSTQLWNVDVSVIRFQLPTQHASVRCLSIQLKPFALYVNALLRSLPLSFSLYLPSPLIFSCSLASSTFLWLSQNSALPLCSQHTVLCNGKFSEVLAYTMQSSQN